MEEFILTAKDGLGISCAVFESNHAKGTVQIVHGAKEHKERYYEFAGFLNSIGYHVILSDNRGHGASVNEDYPLGYMDDWKLMVKDMAMVSSYAKSRYDMPLFMMAHSFGSVLARCYLENNDDMLEGLVLSGTANYIPAANLGVPLGKLIMLFKKKKGHSGLLTKIGDNGDDSWINTDMRVMEQLRADPLCQYKYYNASIVNIWDADRQLHRKKNYKCKNPNLRILSVTGELDPIPGGEKGLEDSVDFLKSVGYHDISAKVYPGMKHEVINTTGKEEVWRDIDGFLNRNSQR